MLAIPLLNIHPKGTKSLSQRDNRAPMFTAASLTITKVWKQRTCPLTKGWIKKIAHTHINIIQPLKVGNPAICDNMDKNSVHFSK